MAKMSAVEKNKRRMKLVKKFETKRKNLKKIVMDKKINLNERFEAALKLAKLPKNSARNRVRNRCEITGRPHGYYRKLKMSRIALRELASMGKIPGMTKSSW
tara:strand:- start:15386 stop:15691 length:306 start_codon:yes stop_codon:yes gene_type:complete